MNLLLKILPPCVLAAFLVGCGEQPRPKMEVTQAAKLPARPSKKREPKAGIESTKKPMSTGAISD